MKISEPKGTWLGDVIAALLTGLWLIALRTLLGTPWGFQPQPVGDLVKVGIVDSPLDTWSYLSWVQQYYHGAELTGILYTTEPHAALLWSFPLWLMGHLAAWTGLSVIGVYNGVGLFAAMAAMLLLRRAAAALRLSAAAVNWASLAFLIGSGGSWLWHVANKLGWAARADGGDMFFLDFFPSTALLLFPYHAVGLALLAGLWWTATELEDRFHLRAPLQGWLAGTAAFALLLGFSRPYEPLAFLGAWTLKTLWHAGRRHRDPNAWRASYSVLLVIGVALAPGVLRTAWISRQPVWSNFAHSSLALGLSRNAWLITLAGWAGLVWLGARPAWKNASRAVVLPLAASLLLALVLLGRNAAQAKMASGLILGPIILSGWAACRMIEALGGQPRVIRVGAVALALSALLGTGSLALNLRTFTLRGPHLVDPELITLAEQLPRPPGSPPPVVLTDADTGAILPGLVGARVWLGHWAFSRDYAAQAELLKRAGLDPTAHRRAGPETSTALSSVLATSAFEYALLDQSCVAARAELLRRGWTLLRATGRWSLLRAPLSEPAKTMP